jgi:excisionase family DNA binding protein
MLEESSELYTVSEVAGRLRVDEITVRRWIKSGILEAVSLPHHGKRQSYRIKRSTLERIITPPRSS